MVLYCGGCVGSRVPTCSQRDAMTWFWYMERANEIMVDLDRATPAQLDLVSRRIEGARECGALDIESVWLYPSFGDRGWHVIVKTTAELLTRTLRAAWAVYLGDDRRRSALNLMRFGRGAGSLLLSPGEWPGFYRPFDYTCQCGSKHTRQMMSTCPVGMVIRPDVTEKLLGTPSREPAGWLEKSGGRVL